MTKGSRKEIADGFVQNAGAHPSGSIPARIGQSASRDPNPHYISQGGKIIHKKMGNGSAAAADGDGRRVDGVVGKRRPRAPNSCRSGSHKNNFRFIRICWFITVPVKNFFVSNFPTRKSQAPNPQKIKKGKSSLERIKSTKKAEKRNSSSTLLCRLKGAGDQSLFAGRRSAIRRFGQRQEFRRVFFKALRLAGTNPSGW